MAGHLGSRRMYDTMRQEFYRPHIDHNVHLFIKQCRKCARTRGTQYTHDKEFKWFPATGPLESVDMDMLGPLLRTHKGNEYVMAIMDR